MHAIISQTPSSDENNFKFKIALSTVCSVGHFFILRLAFSPQKSAKMRHDKDSEACSEASSPKFLTMTSHILYQRVVKSSSTESPDCLCLNPRLSVCLPHSSPPR